MDKIIGQNSCTQNIFSGFHLFTYYSHSLNEPLTAQTQEGSTKILLFLNEMLRSLPIPHEGEPSPGYNAKYKIKSSIQKQASCKMEQAARQTVL